jgi:hypothetical protein
MKELNLIELYKMKKRILETKYSDKELLDSILEAISYKENLIKRILLQLVDQLLVVVWAHLYQLNHQD